MVFITIVTYNRKDFLLDYIDLIKRSLKYTKTKISFNIVAIVILKKYVNNKFYNINWCNFNDKYKIAELDLE